MSNALTVQLTDDQLATLANMIAERIATPTATVGVSGAAALIGGSNDTIRRWAKAGVLRPISALRSLRFTRDEIDRYLHQ